MRLITNSRAPLSVLVAILVVLIVSLALAINSSASHTADPAQETEPAPAFDGELTIATGRVTGLYYMAGGVVCDQINRNKNRNHLDCGVISTDGSIANILALKNGTVQLAIARSDWQHHAYHGTDIFTSEGTFENMRTLFSLHPESFTVVTRNDPSIKEFANIRGKQINLGRLGSGQRAAIELFLAELGLSRNDFDSAQQFSPSEMSNALCTGDVDVLFLAVGHPNTQVAESANACKTKLIPFKDDDIKSVMAGHPYYVRTTIPIDTYDIENQDDIESFGVRATVLTTKDLPEEVAYEIVKAVFNDLARVQGTHAAFRNLVAQNMASEGLSAPLHPGALRYFEEHGLR